MEAYNEFYYLLRILNLKKYKLKHFSASVEITEQ